MLILHGDNQPASRQYFLDHKTTYKSTHQLIELAGDTLTIAELTPLLQTNSLWGQANSIFMTTVFSSRPSDRKKQLVAFLHQQPATTLVTIWEPQDVSPALKTFPSSTIKKFDLPKHIFTFLDTLSVSTLHQALATT